MAQIKRKYFNGPNGQIHARIAGDPDAPAILLLHQAPSSGVMYEKIMDIMAGDYYLIAPDLPGFGMSDALDEKATIERYAGAIWEAVSSTFNKPIHVLGHHTGSSVAVEIAAKNPDSVASLLLSGPVLLSKEMMALLPAMATPFPIEENGSHVQKMWDRMVARDPSPDLDLVLRESLLAIAAGKLYLGAYEAVIAYPMEKRLQEVSCPSLVFAGTGDVLYSAIGPTAKLLSNATTAEMQNTNGYVYDKAPQTVAALIIKFL